MHLPNSSNVLADWGSRNAGAVSRFWLKSPKTTNHRDGQFDVVAKETC